MGDKKLIAEATSAVEKLVAERNALRDRVKKQDSIIECLRWNYKHEVDRVREQAERIALLEEGCKAVWQAHNAPVEAVQAAAATSTFTVTDGWMAVKQREYDHMVKLTEGGGDSGVAEKSREVNTVDRPALKLLVCDDVWYRVASPMYADIQHDKYHWKPVTAADDPALHAACEAYKKGLHKDCAVCGSLIDGHYTATRRECENHILRDCYLCNGHGHTYSIARCDSDTTYGTIERTED